MTTILRGYTRPDWISKVIIRKIQKNDLPGLEWGGELQHFRRLYADIYQSTRIGRAIMWMAELPGANLIGQLFVQLDSARLDLADGINRAYIYGFRIKPEFRGHGIGKLMLETAEGDLIQRQYQLVCLNVAQTNPDAQRLYLRQGYRQVGTDPGLWSYIDDRGVIQEIHEPAWRMEKPIDGTHRN